MIETLRIDGYRCFDHFEMSGLGRVNLLVGTNNSGKTSALESLYLLAAAAHPSAIRNVTSWRGERIVDESEDGSAEFRRDSRGVDISHLFRGHVVDKGSKFCVRAEGGLSSTKVECCVVDNDGLHDEKQSRLFSELETMALGGFLLQVTSEPPSERVPLPITRSGGLEMESLRRVLRDMGKEDRKAEFVQSNSLTGGEVVFLWDEVALTSEEEKVIEALQALEPTIERITSVHSRGSGWVTGGIVARCKGTDRRIPLGSMGDGMRRMLSLALSLIRAEGGLLLVDEIDTGLHYSVMRDMWRMIFSTAERHDVQVFATTHSSDCIASLASVCEKGRSEASHVSIQRIEAGKPQSVAFSESEILMAAERHIEVR